MNIVGTPYSDVHRSAATAFERRLRVERRRRDHDRGPVRRAREIPEHHPEAVVEGHRDADPVLLGVAAALADEEAVVEDVDGG